VLTDGIYGQHQKESRDQSDKFEDSEELTMPAVRLPGNVHCSCFKTEWPLTDILRRGI